MKRPLSALDTRPDLGLFVLRVGAGLGLAKHGLVKLEGLIGGRTDFLDPLGLGPLPTLIIAVFAELLCALAVVVGFKVRWAALPPLATMLVAALMVNANSGWDRQEKPLLFALAFLVVAIGGSGRWALDHWKRRDAAAPRL